MLAASNRSAALGWVLTKVRRSCAWNSYDRASALVCCPNPNAQLGLRYSSRVRLNLGITNDC